jgi:hypothetical protein
VLTHLLVKGELGLADTRRECVLSR